MKYKSLNELHYFISELNWLSHNVITYAHNCEFQGNALQVVLETTPEDCGKTCQTTTG